MRIWLLLFTLLPSAALADMAGQALVADAATIVVDGRSITLFGISVPGNDDPDGWLATTMLRYVVSGRVVRCRDTGARQDGRVVAICYREPEGEDLGRLLVRLGHALDCPRLSGGRYADAEAAARSEGRHLSQDHDLPRRCLP